MSDRGDGRTYTVDGVRMTEEEAAAIAYEALKAGREVELTWPGGGRRLTLEERDG